MARARIAAVLVGAALFTSINFGNALHKGGDFDVFVDAGQRVLDGRPLYAESTPANGVIGPPFQGLFFVPSGWIARRSPVLAKTTWYIANLVALAGGLWLWALALGLGARGSGTWLTGPVLWAIAAIVLPTQTNFEHQNMNALLLCLLGAGVYGLVRSRPIQSGVWFGIAAALKAFPAFVLVYLLVRGAWRAALAGAATAALLTSVAAMRYGRGAPQLIADWLAVHRAGDWPTRLQNQSIYAAVHRVWPASAGALVAAISAAVAVAVLFVAWRRRANVRVGSDEIALVTAASVLLSPIAWDHYWVLLFPALLAVAATSSRAAWLVFGIAAVLITGTSPIFIGTHGFNVARAYSSNTVAGLLLVATLIVLLLLHRERDGRRVLDRSG